MCAGLREERTGRVSSGKWRKSWLLENRKDEKKSVEALGRVTPPRVYFQSRAHATSAVRRMLALRVPFARTHAMGMTVEKPRPRGVTPPGATSDAAQRASVAADYAKVATQSGGCCVSSTPNRFAIGYTEADRKLAGDADLGVGCGTPVRLAGLMPGETVLDLGCGAGIDCFLAQSDVGETGLVIGVDMTPDMLAKAREGSTKRNLPTHNVQFRLGEIENLPCGDNLVDAVISNCVINLSPNKLRVLQESFRVLRPGGRLAVTDVVQTKELPEHLRTNQALSC